MCDRCSTSATGLTKFTHFETLYVILLNIHKRLPKQRCSSHFERPEGKKKYYIHSLALALTLSPTLTFNHLANEPLQPTTMLFSLNLWQRDGTLIFNKVHDRLQMVINVTQPETVSNQVNLDYTRSCVREVTMSMKIFGRLVNARIASVLISLL